MISGIYFDGRSATSHSVELHFKENAINLSGQDLNLLFPVAQVRLNEPFLNAPAFLDLGDGSHCEVSLEEDRASLQQALNYQAAQVVRWQAKWQAALAAIVVMTGLLLSAFFWGIPRLTEVLVSRIPTSAETQIGTELIPLLDKSIFAESRLSDIRMQQAQTVFDSIKPVNPRMPLKLLFRASPSLGANAIALPGGTIVVTDRMIIAITEKSGDLTGDQAKELAGVFAHEIGHVELKHALKSILSNSAVAVISASLFGDYSSVVAAIPVGLVNSEYSRNAESDADEYAIKLLKEHSISPGYMADVFELLQINSDKTGVSKMPKWMRVATDFTASHPSDSERIKRFRDAAVK